MIKKIISCAVVMFIFALSCTNSFAVTDSASKSYSGYGTLKGTIEMEKASNSKSVYLVTTIGKNVTMLAGNYLSKMQQAVKHT